MARPQETFNKKEQEKLRAKKRKEKQEKKEAQNVIDALKNAQVYDSPVVTTIEALTKFYKAEDYHQDYYNNNKNQPYCKMVIQPKIEKFEKLFKSRLKKE